MQQLPQRHDSDRRLTCRFQAAAALANELAPHAATAGLGEVESLSASADIVVNAASLGHAGVSLPRLAPGNGRPFLDLTYGKAAAPALDAAARAALRVEKTLSAYEAPPLDAAIDEELRAFIAQRKAAMADQWY